MRFERLVVQNNGGGGLRYFSGIGDDVGIFTDTTEIVNCDFFYNINNGGEHGDGIKYDQDAGAYVLFEGNRVMFNSDDGIDASGSATRVIRNNWAFGQGWDTGGNGNGFKVGAWFCSAFESNGKANNKAVTELETIRTKLEPNILYGGYGKDDNLKELPFSELGQAD